MYWVAKPEAAAYRAALALVGVEPPQAVFVDDALRNVAGARQVGLYAILCHPPPHQPWSPHIPDILALPQALANLTPGIA